MLGVITRGPQKLSKEKVNEIIELIEPWLRCRHSLVAEEICSDYNGWNLEEIDLRAGMARVFFENPRPVIRLSSNPLFICVVEDEDSMKILFTVTKKQRPSSAFCSDCSSVKCKHYKKYRTFRNEMLESPEDYQDVQWSESDEEVRGFRSQHYEVCFN